MIDFHMHSNCSDGYYSPGDLVAVAANKGLKYIALTDHNNVNGLVEAAATAKNLGITFVNGIEFSCEYNTHITGLFLKRFDEINEKNVLRGEYMKLSLKHYGFDVNKYKSLRSARDACVRKMIDSGIATNKTFAIEHFLQPPFGYGEAIDLIHRCGGLAILAHPNRTEGVDKNSLPNFLTNLMHYNLDGIEVYQSGQTDEYTDFVKNLADENNLLISGGSDFHNPKRTDRELGMYGNIDNRRPIPDEVFEILWQNKDRYR